MVLRHLNNINFPFGVNRKLMVLGTPTLKNIRLVFPVCKFFPDMAHIMLPAYILSFFAPNTHYICAVPVCLSEVCSCKGVHLQNRKCQTSRPRKIQTTKRNSAIRQRFQDSIFLSATSTMLFRLTKIGNITRHRCLSLPNK